MYKFQPLVFIILVNYNGWNDTIDCIHSLKKIEYKNYRIIVVDNASQDNPPQLVQTVIANSHYFISAPKNGGFSYGNNLGIRCALENGADYVLLLNNDTLVEPNFLTIMVKKIQEDSKIGILGCLILYHSDQSKVWFNGAGFNWLKGTGVHYDLNRDVEDAKYNPQIDYITGCVMLIPNKVLAEAGLLDENYFMYYEDVAFSMAVKSKGFRLDYIPEAIVYHKVGNSGGGGNENYATVLYGNQSRLQFINSEYSMRLKGVRFIAKSYFYCTRIVKFSVYLISGNKILSNALLKALFPRRGKNLYI